MKELNGQQFLQELLTVSGMTQTQVAKVLNVSQGSISNMIKKGNPNILAIKKIANHFFSEANVIIELRCQLLHFAAFDWSYKNIIDVLTQVVDTPTEQIAEKMNCKAGTLRSRLSRNSCTLYQLKEHLEALGFEMIISINFQEQIKIV